jgi:hypothetical protein
MRINKTRQNDFARAIDLENFLAILLQPGIAQGLFGRADGNDLPPQAQNSAVLDDAELPKVGTAARTGPGQWGPERKQVADIG